VYGVPFVKPGTVNEHEVADTLIAPGLEVTVYPVIVPPPLLAGGVHETVADAFPGVPTTPVGAPGA
jgi:hypothetical protein